MNKQTKKPAWMIMILIQALLGTCIGFSALSRYQIETLPDGTCVNDIHIGGLRIKEARTRLQEYHDYLASKGRIEIAVGQDRYIITYEQIDAYLDVDETLNAIFKELSGNALNSFIAGRHAQTAHHAVVPFNEGKLSAELEKIFSQYDREPVPDSYRVEDGKLIYSPGTSGIRVDYDALRQRVSARIESLCQDVLALDPEDPEIFVVYNPDNMAGAGSFRHIVSSSRIELGETDQSETEAVLKELDGSMIPSGGRLQLSKMLDLSNMAQEGRKDLVDRAATAVYQAFLSIKGITTINRMPSEIPLPYADPGLEAVIQGEDGDLILENDTGQPLMLLCELRDKSLQCYVIAPEDIPSGILAAVKKDVVAPPEIYTVSDDLGKGETRIVSKGQEGFTVDVERIIGNDREKLYTDTYDPVSRVIEVGANPLQKGSK